MNILTEIIIPGVVICIANIFSREHGSSRYEEVTAVFGWIAVAFLVTWVILLISSFFIVVFFGEIQILSILQQVTFQIGSLFVFTAIFRDYERYLKPFAPYFEERLKILYKKFTRKKPEE